MRREVEGGRLAKANGDAPELAQEPVQRHFEPAVAEGQRAREIETGGRRLERCLFPRSGQAGIHRGETLSARAQPMRLERQ